MFKFRITILYTAIIVCLLACGDDDTNDLPKVSNNVKVIYESGSPAKNTLVSLRGELVGLRLEAKTNDEGIAKFEYEDYSIEAYYDFTRFFVQTVGGDRKAFGYAVYQGPNIDHTIVIYDEEVLTVEVLTEGIGDEVYPLKEPIEVDMIFHSKKFAPGYYSLELSSPFGNYEVYNEPEDLYEYSTEVYNYLDEEGRLKFRYSPQEAESQIRIQYRDCEFNQFDIIYDIRAE